MKTLALISLTFATLALTAAAEPQFGRQESATGIKHSFLIANSITALNTNALGIDEGRATIESSEQARAALVYPLAIFLVCAEEHSYFRVHEGYSANENDHWKRWLPEYDCPLGPLKGPSNERRLSLFPIASARHGSTRHPETNGQHPVGRMSEEASPPPGKQTAAFTDSIA